MRKCTKRCVFCQKTATYRMIDAAAQVFYICEKCRREKGLYSHGYVHFIRLE
jgi:hypothetical protein